MPFCQNCGNELQPGAKFCGNCGHSQTNSPAQAPTSPTPQQAPPTKMIGIYKELEPGEKIVYQGVTQTEVIFVKEAMIKKVIGQERKEIPISISGSVIYLTSQRLAFLKLFELSATELGEEKNMLAGAAGTFYEVPVSAITAVDMRPIRLNANDEARFVDFFGGDVNILKRPALEVIYDEKAATGRAKDYIESMLQRPLLSKLWGAVQGVYDKMFILGEQSVALQPYLSGTIRQRASLSTGRVTGAFCKFCGTSLIAGSAYCPKCGRSQV